MGNELEGKDGVKEFPFTKVKPWILLFGKKGSKIEDVYLVIQSDLFGMVK